MKAAARVFRRLRFFFVAPFTISVNALGLSCNALQGLRDGNKE
jgi:hypothetical protein